MEELTKKRIRLDLDKRTINGSYIYLVAWVLIGVSTDFYSEQASIFWSITALYFMFGMCRIVASFVFLKLPDIHFKPWCIATYFNSLAPALVCGSVFGLTLIRPEFEPLFIYMLMKIFALISAGSSVFAPYRQLSFSYLACLTVPAFISTLFLAENKELEGLMLALYTIFMLLQVSKLHHEYLTMIKQQQLLEDLSNHDPLTGVYNRRYFDSTLSRTWKTHLRSEQLMSLMLLDIDHFKQVNDKHGHAVGDKVIQVVTQIVGNMCQRETDEVARTGGEEFAVLISTSDREWVNQQAEAIRQEIAAHAIATKDYNVQVTISIGIAHCSPDHQKSPEELYKQADKYLYQAKSNGRNLVVSGDY